MSLDLGLSRTEMSDDQKELRASVHEHRLFGPVTVVGRKVRALAAEKGISQAKLSRKSGVSPAAISRLLDGSIQQPKADTIQKLASVLGVPPSDLLEAPPGYEGVVRVRVVEWSDGESHPTGEFMPVSADVMDGHGPLEAVVITATAPGSQLVVGDRVVIEKNRDPKVDEAVLLGHNGIPIDAYYLGNWGGVIERITNGNGDRYLTPTGDVLAAPDVTVIGPIVTIQRAPQTRPSYLTPRRG